MKNKIEKIKECEHKWIPNGITTKEIWEDQYKAETKR